MKFPKNEKFLLTIVNPDGKYLITRCMDGSGYAGYQEVDGEWKRFCKKKDPLAVEEAIDKKSKKCSGEAQEQGVKSRAKKVD